MSREVIDELIENIKGSQKKDFPEILESIVEYGFAEETDLCKLLKIDSSELDELLSDTENLKSSTWNKYANALLSYLKKARKTYEKLYFRSDGSAN